jgi:hypothetical protein
MKEAYRLGEKLTSQELQTLMSRPLPAAPNTSSNKAGRLLNELITMFERAAAKYTGSVPFAKAVMECNTISGIARLLTWLQQAKQLLHVGSTPASKEDCGVLGVLWTRATEMLGDAVGTLAQEDKLHEAYGVPIAVSLQVNGAMCSSTVRSTCMHAPHHVQEPSA